MAKATLTLPNGTHVVIEGTPEEVHRLLGLSTGTGTPSPAKPSAKGKRKPKAKSPTTQKEPADGGGADITEIVNLAKDCDEADSIEKNILDRTSIVDRVLLPLYVLKKHVGSANGLTSGEVSRVTTELGVPVSQPNASTALSGSASKYVMGDRVRRKGHPVRYRLSRRGEQYLAAVIRGKAGED